MKKLMNIMFLFVYLFSFRMEDKHPLYTTQESNIRSLTWSRNSYCNDMQTEFQSLSQDLQG